MKKVIFVTTAIGGGGAERVLSIIANNFARDNYEVEIISVISPRNEYYIEPSIKTVYLATNLKNNIFKLVSKYIKLRKEIRKSEADCIISFGWLLNIMSLLACKNFHCKIIISERNDPYLVPSRNIIRRFRNFLYRKADCIVFQTLDAKNYFASKIDGTGVIIGNPILKDLPYYKYSQHATSVVAVGRLNNQKNFTMLISAFSKFLKKHPDYTLQIIGDGPEKNSLETLVNKIKINNQVEFLTYCNNVHDYISNCAMYVSSSNFEGISNAMLESLAIGAPVICTDCPIGGARMYITNKVNGMLISVGDIDALVDAMNYLADNSERAFEMGKNAIKIREELAEEKIYIKWKQIIESD